MLRLILATALVVMVEATTVSAQPRVRARPLVATFIGVFQPYDEAKAGALQTLTVTDKSNTWLFTVDRLEVISGSPNSGNMILSRIAPPRLVISGPKEFIESLKQPESIGKRFILQGWPDLKVRTFRVVEVKEEARGRLREQIEPQTPHQQEEDVQVELPTDLPFALENPANQKKLHVRRKVNDGKQTVSQEKRPSRGCSAAHGEYRRLLPDGSIAQV